MASNTSIRDMLITLTLHAKESGYILVTDYVNDVVMSGKSRYSEDMSLYLAVTSAINNI